MVGVLLTKCNSLSLIGEACLLSDFNLDVIVKLLKFKELILYFQDELGFSY